jgi:phage regulator Rha-like protein
MKVMIILEKIYEIRGIKVMLDSDLAALYEMDTKVLKQSVRRNLNRFPSDFMFELTKGEYESLRSQIVTLKGGRGTHPKYLPFAFTEHGVAMIASVLNSDKAIAINIAIVKAFIAMREMALNMKVLSIKITALEKKYNKQFADVYEALNFLITEKKADKAQKERVRIGFKK